MGNSWSSRSHDYRTGKICYQSNVPLCFHETRGDNITLSYDKIQAKRSGSFCKGICFSNRPIFFNEMVYIRFVETNSNWSGVLRFGFSSVDPSTICGSDLPRYVCPDLISKPGYWAKALCESYSTNNILLFFYVTQSGCVYYGVNGREKGLFFKGVDTNRPLWAVMDIYGNTVGIEFAQPNGGRVPENINVQDNDSACPMHTHDFFPLSSLNKPMLMYHANVSFKRIHLSSLCGQNVCVSCDGAVATRSSGDYCNGYIFTAQPMAIDHRIVIQVLGIDQSFVGGFSFGLTACDPSTLTRDSLPDDADLLLDRPEYWVVHKDIRRNVKVGDELGFTVTNEGKVLFSLNNLNVVTLMHVDCTLPLWAFFDIYGNVQQVKVVGAFSMDMLNNVQSALKIDLSHAQVQTPSLFSQLDQAKLSTASATLPSPLLIGHCRCSLPYCSDIQTSRSVAHADGDLLHAVPPVHARAAALCEKGKVCSECVVCCEEPVNCVLYTCGHMCMCFECATAVKDHKGGLCPICRQSILDVIRTYRS